MTKQQMKNKKSVYFIMLVLMTVVSAIFLNSFHWPYDEISKRKIIVWAIAVFCIVIFPILFVKITFFYNVVQHVLKKIEMTIEKIKHNKKWVVYLLLSVAVSVGLSVASTYLICELVLQKEFNVRLFYLILSICALIILIIFRRQITSNKPERVFFCIALIMGVFCIGATPDKTGVSWDDQIHYQRTLEISNFFNGIMYDADWKNITEYVFQPIGYDRDTNLEYVEDMENSYRGKECTLYANLAFSVKNVAYIPGAIGIIMARGLGLSYVNVYNFGRLCNLLMYSMLLYFAIKRIRYGKVLIAIVGLLPPSIFMASCYSYDPWVTGFIILGYAYFFAELQEDTPLQNKSIWIMIGAFVIGCLPKAIYFSLLFPLLFMPKKKFKNINQRRFYYLAIIGGGLLLVATFLLPMFIQGAGVGDVRGGTDVNSTEQIQFILNNPLKYVKILVNFCLGYIAMDSSGPMLQFFAYVGQGQFWGIIGITLIVVAFLDREHNNANHTGVKFCSLLGCVVTLFLSATALYISFTAVASETVAGMSGRYLIPLIYPALYSLGAEGTTHRINKNVFVFVPMLIMAITFIYNISKVCVIGY